MPPHGASCHDLMLESNMNEIVLLLVALYLVVAFILVRI